MMIDLDLDRKGLLYDCVILQQLRFEDISGCFAVVVADYCISSCHVLLLLGPGQSKCFIDIHKVQ